jgi:Major tropism determinant N-terminal domain
MASVSIIKLKIRRGTNAERQQIILDNGELGYTTDYDSRRVFVGDGVTYGGISVGAKLFYADVTNFSTYRNCLVGDIIYDSTTSSLYSVSSINTSSAIPDFGFSKLVKSAVTDDTYIQYNGLGQLTIMNNSVDQSKIKTTCFNQTLSGGNGLTIGVNYDNSKITVVGGKLTVNEASLDLSLLNGATLPLSLPASPGKLYNSGGFVKIS